MHKSSNRNDLHVIRNSAFDFHTRVGARARAHVYVHGQGFVQRGAPLTNVTIENRRPNTDGERKTKHDWTLNFASFAPVRFYCREDGKWKILGTFASSTRTIRSIPRRGRYFVIISSSGRKKTVYGNTDGFFVSPGMSTHEMSFETMAVAVGIQSNKSILRRTLCCDSIGRKQTNVRNVCVRAYWRNGRDERRRVEIRVPEISIGTSGETRRRTRAETGSGGRTERADDINWNHGRGRVVHVGRYTCHVPAGRNGLSGNGLVSRLNRCGGVRWRTRRYYRSQRIRNVNVCRQTMFTKIRIVRYKIGFFLFVLL